MFFASLQTSRKIFWVSTGYCNIWQSYAIWNTTTSRTKTCVRSKTHIRILWKHYPQASWIIPAYLTGTEVLIQLDQWLTLAWQWMAEACVHIWLMMNRSKKQAASTTVWEWQSSLSSHQTMAELNISMPSLVFHCTLQWNTNDVILLCKFWTC